MLTAEIGRNVTSVGSKEKGCKVGDSCSQRGTDRRELPGITVYSCVLYAVLHCAVILVLNTTQAQGTLLNSFLCLESYTCGILQPA